MDPKETSKNSEPIPQEETQEIIRPKNYRERYIDLLAKIDKIIKKGRQEIDYNINDHKNFCKLLDDLIELRNSESEHFAEIRKYRKAKSDEALTKSI
jgi:hypothetical protein